MIKRSLLAVMLLPLFLVGQQLVKNPRFESLTAAGKPVGWYSSGSVRVEKDADGMGNRVILEEGSGVSQKISLKPEMGELTLRFWMKTTDVRAGDQSWKTGRLAMSFRSKQNKQVGGWPDVFGYVGTNDWTYCERKYRIPLDAVLLDFSCSHFASGGTVEFRDVTFTVSARRALKPENAECPIDAVAAQSIDDAWQQVTPTRTTYSLNGLWQVRPVTDDKGQLPGTEDCWGWMKVPHAWQSNWTTAGKQKITVAQWLFDHHLDTLKKVEQAWFKRRFAVPKTWSGKDVAIEFGLVNTYAQVYVDGQVAGELFFPGGEINVTKFVKPGTTQEIAVLVKAMPLDAGASTFMAPDRILKGKAKVGSRGLCGDVYLHVRPKTQRIDFLTIVTSVSKGTIEFKADVFERDERTYGMSVDVTLPNGSVKRFEGKGLRQKDGVVAFTSEWKDAPLWDIDQPQLMSAKASLTDGATGRLLDQYTPVAFGFREFLARGKDLTLNGTVIRLRALHCYVGSRPEADLSSVHGAKNWIKRARVYGFNFLINAHYNFRYGCMSHLEGLLQATQETGMLMSFSLPHLADFQWKLDDPEVRKQYESMTKFVIRKVVNNPAVVMYAMNHNATGYFGDQNPLKIDGKYQFDPPDTDWDDLSVSGRAKRRVQAKMSERIAKRIDGTRLVYHHESGNLGDLHCINIYLNWSPMQERSDWMAHWASEGVKPVFFVEWGLPHISTWSSYRGPAFIWRVEAFQSLWAAEFASAEYGEEAYRQAASKGGATAIDHEEKLWGTGKPFTWSRLNWPLRRYPFYHQLMGRYTRDNWRSHRTFGVSAMLPWDQGELWQRIKPNGPGLAYTSDLTKLKRPGISPDVMTGWGNYLEGIGNDGAYGPTAVGQEFLLWNQETLGYIGGRRDAFTEKVHVYRPGETVEKTVVVVNDTRRRQSAKAVVTFGGKRIELSTWLEPGQIDFLPFSVKAPEKATAEGYAIDAVVEFSNGQKHTDSFMIHVLPKSEAVRPAIQLYDPKGLTAVLLKDLGYTDVTMLGETSTPDLRKVVVIGREALELGTSLPWLADAMRRGRVVVFEQSQQVLAQRLGFRTNIHGLRDLFVTKGSHAILDKSLGAFQAQACVNNWRGDSTLTPPFLEVAEREQHDPVWEWHGFRNTRVWRAGNRGNVASVLIEKPTVGDWHPLLVGGFDMQYAPLLLHRSGEGMTLFCQLDVTGRTEREPAADNLVQGMLEYMSVAPLAKPSLPVFYAGGPEGEKLLTALNVTFKHYVGQRLDGALLVAGKGCAGTAWTAEANGRPARVLGLGLTAKDLAWAPLNCGALTVKDEAGYANVLPVQADTTGVLDGLTSSETYFHAKMTYCQLPVDAANVNPSLGVYDGGKVVIQQLPAWCFDIVAKPYLRISERRALFLTSRLLSNMGAGMNAGLLPEYASSRSPIVNMALADGWVGVEDPKDVGRKDKWHLPTFDASSWKPIKVGATFESQRKHLATYDGLFWYRIEFDTPELLSELGTAILDIGAIDDESWIWLNGHFLGEVTVKTHPKNYWSALRSYRIDKKLLKTSGKNVLVIRINDNFNTGGVLHTPRFRFTQRWEKSYYLQKVQKGDDPYRYYRW